MTAFSTQALDHSERFLLAEEIFCSVRYRTTITNINQIMVQNSGRILNTNPHIRDQLIRFFTILAGAQATLHESYYSCSKFCPISSASNVIFYNSSAMLVNAMFTTDLVQF